MIFVIKKHNDLAKLLLLSAFIKTLEIVFDYIISKDSVRYINSAHAFSVDNLKMGMSYAESLPFFSWMLLAFHHVVDDWIISGQILTAIIWSLAVIPLYLLSRDLFGGRAAFWSGLAFVLSPILNDYSGDILREAPFAFFILCAGFYARRSFENIRVIDFVLTSVCVLLAHMFRFEGAVFFLVFPLLILGFVCFDRQLRMVWLRGLAGYLAVPALLVIGFFLALRGNPEGMRWGGGVAEFVGNVFSVNLLGVLPETYEKLSQVERLFANAQWGNDIIETTRQYIAIVYVIGLMDSFVTTMTLLYFIVAAYGIYNCNCGKKYINRCMLTLAFAALPAGYVFLVSKNFISGRYLLTSVLLLYPWIGVGFVSLCERIRQSSRGTWLKPAVVMFFVLVPTLGTARHWSFGPRAHVELAQWLGSNVGTHGKIITNDERLMLYAGYFRGEYVVYPDDEANWFENVAPDVDVLIIRSSRKSVIPGKNEKFIEKVTFVDGKSTIRVYLKSG